jgi:CubicO group peptidase (beta-lactamase class C family)
VTVRLTFTALACALTTLVAAPAAHAAKSCPEPGADWERATPAEAGMDAAGLQDAMDYGSQNASYAVRVYRRGCLVAEDRLASQNRNAQYESWSMAKSVTALVFGRAMTEGLLSPDDVVGSLVPEADAAHGKIRVHDLLTMTSGLKWNGLRDYNIFTMPDRIVDALTLEPVHEPGTYYEYAQSAVSLLAEVVGRSAGQETQWFAQRQLMDPLGIEEGTWSWVRDKKGHVGGFYGVNMRPDDFGRMGELMRRGGVWRGRRLLSKEFIERAVAPSATNGCYGWLIWVNAGKPCIGPRISERPVKPTVEFPTLPRDMYRFVGLFGQLVTVFPTQELVVVRTGQDPNLHSSSGGWESGLYDRVLGAIRDTKVPRPTGDDPAPVRDEPNPDQGFQNALAEPDQYTKGISQDPLPPAGPQRARAPRFELALPRISTKGTIVLRVFCPPRPARPCDGRATLPRTRGGVRYSVPAGDSRLVRFTLTARNLRAARGRRLTLPATLTNEDALGGVTITRDVALQGPPPRKAKAKKTRSKRQGSSRRRGRR